MAKYIDLTDASHGQPFGADANQWMQDMTNAQAAAAVITWIGEQYNAAYVYLLYGGVLSSSGGTTTVTAGMAFSNGTFIPINAASYPDPSGGDVNILTYTVSYGDGVGTDFEDGFVKNVLINGYYVVSAGASGSGSLNYTDLVQLSTTWEDGGAITNTYNFIRNKTWRRNAITGGGATITLSTTYARVGTEVIILADATTGDTITFAGGVGIIVATGTSSLTAPSGTLYVVIKIKLATLGTGTKCVGEVYWYQ